MVEHTQAWEQLEDEEGRAIPRRAGVSSFGFGGTNAHVALEEYEHSESPSDAENGGEHVIVLSAKNQERLKDYVRATAEWLNSPEVIPHSLEEIAYTFQTGREAMDERIAVVVTTRDDLCKKLQRYIKGNQKIQNLYWGNVKEQKETYAPLLDGEAGEAFIRVVLQKQEFAKLAQLWVLTGDINWELLYHGQHPRRVSLPTYPFAKERYWIPESEEESGPIEQPLPTIEPIGELTRLPEAEWTSLSDAQRQTSLGNLEKERGLKKAFEHIEQKGGLKRLPEAEWPSLSDTQRQTSLRNLEKEFSLKKMFEHIEQSSAATEHTAELKLLAEAEWSSLSTTQRRASIRNLEAVLGSQ